MATDAEPLVDGVATNPRLGVGEANQEAKSEIMDATDDAGVAKTEWLIPEFGGLTGSEPLDVPIESLDTAVVGVAVDMAVAPRADGVEPIDP